MSTSPSHTQVTMDTITKLSLHLLQITHTLHDKVQAGELESINDLQQQRATLVSALDTASRQPWPEQVLIKSRALIEQSRALEKEIIANLTEKRDAISHEHNQLQQNQKARKAYGSFS